MILQLQPAQLIKRYKRFLADVISQEKQVFTLHCANTGAMTGCAESGDTVWYSSSDNPKRKYPCSWELTHTKENHWICVNTIRANQLVEEALRDRTISEFAHFDTLQREVKYGNENSKVDFLLTQTGQNIYLEVKSVTLLTAKQGYFPDAVTTRGQKHLRELTELAQQGKQAVLLFAVLHSGIDSVKAAVHIDKEYANLLQAAQQAGVKIMAYKASFNQNLENTEIRLTHPVPVKL